jgi:hypothetical protein
LQKARERRRDALCHGETTLPRRRHQLSGLALAALMMALAHFSMMADARGQESSVFQPSLTDPRSVQRFSTPGPAARSTGPSTPPATAKEILPPSGAGETGFDSTGATSKKRKAKKKPGEPRPLPPPPPPAPGAPQAATGNTSAQQIKVRAPYADAFKPADAPPRRPAPPPQDAYEPLGIRVGTFLLKPSIEVTRGFDNNPTRATQNGASSGYTVVEPTLKMKSEWARHEFGMDLRGSYSDYDKVSPLNRPLLDTKAYSRFDVSRDTAINAEARLFLSTDYPGSPNLPVGFAKLPVYTSYGTTLGLTQRFNHLELTAKATVDRTQYQNTLLLDGSTSSNQDRDFNQFGGAVRASYEVFPGVKPFVEVGGDTRIHDLQFDRDGLQRDSKMVTPRVGTTFDLARRLTGEISVGYLARKFEDPGLPVLGGIVADASLIWNATGLTTATLTASSKADETVLPGVSGVLRRDIGVQVDHALRRWLIWTVRAGYGFDDYVSEPCDCNGFLERKDTRASLGTSLTYKFTRELSIKGEYRYDRLRSNSPGSNYDASAFLVGLKLQR